MKLNFHQQILAYAALYGNRRALISYNLSSDKGRIFENILKSESEFKTLAQKFRKGQKEILAILRDNMFCIMTDRNLSLHDREDRLNRYLPDWFGLMCLLDKAAFPREGNKIYNFVPTYIPDNLSDLGSDLVLDDKQRSREKIHITKDEMFKQAWDLFFEVFKIGQLNKRLIISNVAKWIYKNFPYDHTHKGSFFGSHSVPIVNYKSKDPTAVCRHHALYAQVFNQAFGLTSRLLKCTMDGSSHAANLVRIDMRWHLLDVTNPIMSNGKWHICLIPIPQTDVDLNKKAYTWNVPYDKGIRTYISRNNMYFRIK